MPRFLILGAAKAGTTSLYEYLCQHPQVRSSIVKEVHFFDQHYERGTGWYQAHFPRLKTGETTGEATPYYLFHPAVPIRVQRHLPNGRFIVLLRNPIDRLVSQHSHEFADGFEKLTLEEALAREPERLADAEKLMRRNHNHSSFAHQHYSYAARSRYADQLERWFGYFDREQFLILSAEDLFDSPMVAVEMAQRHLGLDVVEPNDLAARNARSYDQISAELRSSLQAAFAPHNDRLYELVGRDFGWS